MKGFPLKGNEEVSVREQRKKLKGRCSERVECDRMPTAYVLINTEEFSQQLMKALREIKGVEEAYSLYGVYDIIVRTRAATMDKLRETHDKIRKLEKVRQTLTMITHEE